MLCALLVPLMLAASADSVRLDTTKTSPTIVVEAETFSNTCDRAGKCGGATSVDGLMQMSGIVLIQRAQMAGEATIRGLRGGQITTTIDGMKVHAACVDKMDPATAYIELDNLNRLELTQGASDLRYGANLGGSVNFNSRMPLFGPMSGKTDVAFDVNGLSRRASVDVNASTDDVAMRVGYTFRQSDDYRAGNRTAVLGSSLMKHNASAVAQWHIDTTSSLFAQIIYDLATDIGYPALLMDTRSAEAIISSVQWRERWSTNASTSVRLYLNHVDHLMDDFNRPLHEIETRAIMPNMRMPMSGLTTTAGLISELQLTTSSASILSFTLDVWNLDAKATMDMIPLNTAVLPMRLTNIGDARIDNAGANVTWENALNEDVVLRLTTRLDVNASTLRDANSRSTLMGYTGNVDMSPFRVAATLHASLQWQVTSGLSLAFALARAERMPTHLEQFGFYLYDPQADIITIGNPGLRTEKSMNVDARIDYTNDFLRIKGSVYTQAISDFIAAPVPSAHLDDSLDLRMMKNVGNALLAGADIACSIELSDMLVFGTSAAYTFGMLTETREPLPFIQPLTMSMNLLAGNAERWGEIRIRGALAQTRLSTTLITEDATASWAVVDLSAGLQFATSWSAKVVLANLLDTYYNEHTSIRNLPARGRSLSVVLRYTW